MCCAKEFHSLWKIVGGEATKTGIGTCEIEDVFNGSINRLVVMAKFTAVATLRSPLMRFAAETIDELRGTFILHLINVRS